MHIYEEFNLTRLQIVVNLLCVVSEVSGSLNTSFLII